MVIYDKNGNTLSRKQLPSKPHLYKMVVLTTGEIYIGVHNGKMTHYYSGGGSIIKNRIKKYGKENVEKYILEVFDDIHDAYKREEEVVNIDFINQDHVLNIRTGGRIYEGSYQMSEEYKKRMSVLNSGENNPMYGVRGEDHQSWGKKHSDQTKEIISEKNIKRFEDPEERKKISDKLKEYFQHNDNPFKGKKHSKEAIDKMKVALNKNKIKCEYCGNEYAKHLYKRWHGQNCKHKY